MSDAPQSTRFSPRTIKYALMASLALNVLIIGGIIGSLCFSPHGPRRPGPANPLLGFAQTLPADRAEVIKQSYANSQEELRALRKAEREAWHATRDRLVEQPFDQSQLTAALQAAVDADGKEKMARMTLFAETVSKLTPEERKALHDWLEKRRPRR
jgi:uncharacterized membrane protein